jgi:hypothetical protein
MGLGRAPSLLCRARGAEEDHEAKVCVFDARWTIVVMNLMCCGQIWAEGV